MGENYRFFNQCVKIYHPPVELTRLLSSELNQWLKMRPLVLDITSYFQDNYGYGYRGSGPTVEHETITTLLGCQTRDMQRTL